MLTKTRFTETLEGAFTAMPGGSRCEDCPEPEVLWAALQGEQGGLSAEERRAIVRHTAECSACAEDWRVTWGLIEAQKKADRNDEPCPVTNGHPSWFGENLYKVAAAALVVLAVGVGGWFFHPAPESKTRGERNQDPQTQENPTLDGASLPRHNFLLTWPAITGATYKVRVMNEDGDFLLTTPDLNEPEYWVPPEALEQIPSGGAVLWQVEESDVDSESRSIKSFITYIK